MLMPPPGDLPPVAVILFNPRGIDIPFFARRPTYQHGEVVLGGRALIDDLPGVRNFPWNTVVAPPVHIVWRTGLGVEVAVHGDGVLDASLVRIVDGTTDRRS